MAYFKISAEELEPGAAEVGVMIPRSAVKDELPALGEEFEKLQEILNPFLELTEGSRPPLKVRTISSSDFAVYVAMWAGTAYAVAQAMDKILGLYKTILEIRRLHKELSDQGVSDEALAPIEAEANTRMATETERIADEMVDAAVISNAGRANELKIELRLSLNALANRIDHGYNVDVPPSLSQTRWRTRHSKTTVTPPPDKRCDESLTSRPISHSSIGPENRSSVFRSARRSTSTRAMPMNHQRPSAAPDESPGPHISAGCPPPATRARFGVMAAPTGCRDQPWKIDLREPAALPERAGRHTLQTWRTS